MAFDAHKNLGIGTVVTAPTPPTTGTTVTVGAGEGARFPAAPFNGTVWAADMPPDPTTAEVWRCTARAGDVLTLVRAQEGTTARAIVAGDLIAATITAKSLTDIESGVNFPLINTPGTVTGLTLAATSTGDVVASAGGGTAFKAVLLQNTGGGYRLGVEASAGNTIITGAPAYSTCLTTITPTPILFGINFAERGRMHASGGFSWGGTTDPGAGNLSVSGTVFVNRSAEGEFLTSNTVTGVYNRARISNGNTTFYFGVEDARNLLGQGANAGYFYADSAAGMQFTAAHPGGAVRFATGGYVRGTMHPSGGFSWGGTTDPGAGNLQLGGAFGAGNTFATLTPGLFYIGNAGSAATVAVQFYNTNGGVGNIQTSGTVTAYNTTSDARLKTPLSRHSDTDVLRQTVIHNFVWKSDGTPGRGVFAQEAALVAPFAVSVGTDETDEEGRLTHPWGVDYSKYVPDLITGWQVHEAQHRENLNDLNDLHIRLNNAEQDLRELRRQLAPPPPPNAYLRKGMGGLWAWFAAIWRKPSWV